nr:hypothetical protein [Tanacetum cinerariifolium]
SGVDVDTAYPSVLVFSGYGVLILFPLWSLQAILVDESVNPLKKVEYPGYHDSKDEVALVDNDLNLSLVSERTRFSTQSLLEQWRNSYGNGDYDEDMYDDDMYEGHDLFKEIQIIYDKMDIRVRSRKKPNGDALRKCILEGPYTPTTVVVLAVPATDDSLAVFEHTTVETPMNMSSENKAHYQSKKEAIHLILTGIGDEIYLTVDACKIAQEMWEAIERLQQEWSRFVTIVKQQHKLDEVSYHKLFNILKQYKKEVSELRAERIAKNANPLALVATAQNKGKEIAKPITPPSESASDEDSNLEQAQRDKDMQKNLALIAKYFKKIYKPTNNNLRTSSKSRNKNVDTTPRENVGSPVVQQSGIQCFNCKEFSHFAKECRKPKRVKDSAYHKEKMLLCKQAEKGVPLQAEQSDWLADTYEEIDEQELEAHYSYMTKIQEFPTADSDTDFEPLE